MELEQFRAYVVNLDIARLADADIRKLISLFSEVDYWANWIIRGLKRPICLGGLCCEDFEKVLSEFAALSGHIRAAIITDGRVNTHVEGGGRSSIFHQYLVTDHKYCQKITKYLNSKAQKWGLERTVPNFCTLVIGGSSAVFEYRLFSKVNDAPNIYIELRSFAVSCISYLCDALSLHGGKDIVAANFSIYGVGGTRPLGKRTIISIDPPYPGMQEFVKESADGLVAYFASSQYSYADLPREFAAIQLEVLIGGPQMDPTFYRKLELEQMVRTSWRPLDDVNLLHATHQRATPTKTRYEVAVGGGKLQIARSQLQFTANFNPIFLEGLPGGISAYARGYHRQTDFYPLPRKVARNVPLAISEAGVTINTLSKLGREFYRKFSTTTRTIRPRRGRVPARRTPFAVLDFETVTINDKLVPYLLGLSVDNEYTAFSSNSPESTNAVEAFIARGVEFMLAKCSCRRVFAHNLANFDLILLVPHLVKYIQHKHIGAELSEELLFTVRGGRTISVELPRYGIIFVDSRHFLQMSLDTMGRAFVGRGKPTFDHKAVTPESLKQKSVLKMAIDYNKADCELLSSSLKRFEEFIIDRYNIAPFKSLTLPGLSYKIWRTVTSNLESYQITFPPVEVERMIRAAYRGGRCEVFAKHAIASEARKIHAIDFISLYPAVAYNYDFPSGVATAFHQAGGANSHVRGALPLGVYFCKISCPKTPPLGEVPFLSTKFGAYTIYPTGTWFACYTSVEINYALSLGYYTIYVYSGYTYPRTCSPFKEYISNVFEWKEVAERAGNSGQRSTAKLLANALFGKFGQKSEKTKAMLIETAKMHRYMGGARVKVTDSRAVDDQSTLITMTYPGGRAVAAPQIAAWVTAYGRVLLHRGIRLLVEKFNAELYYVDTDSITFSSKKFDIDWLNSEISRDFLEPRLRTLGLLSKVYKDEEITEFFVIAPKVYHITFSSGKTVAKLAGFPVEQDIAADTQLWNDLKDTLLRKHPGGGAPALIPVAPGRPTKDRHRYELIVSKLTAKNVTESSQSQIKSIPAFDTKGELTRLSPPHVTMSDHIGMLYSHELQRAQTIPPEWYSSHSGLPEGELRTVV